MRARAGGIVRYVLKDSLKYVPLYGYFLYKHGSVFIRRKVDAQSVISKQLQRLMQQKRPVSLSSKRIGGSKGVAPLKHVLTSSLLVATGLHPTNTFGTSVNVLSSILSRHRAQLMTHSASPPPTLLSPPPPQLWLCLFPEGTRFSQAKSVSGQLQASGRGYPPLQHVLQPKVKGLQVCL